MNTNTNTNTNTNIDRNNENIKWIKIKKDFVIESYPKSVAIDIDGGLEKVYIAKGKYDGDHLISPHIKTSPYTNFIECMIITDRIYSTETKTNGNDNIKGEMNGDELIARLRKVNAIENRNF